jgi:hypothetical protein
LRDEPPPFLCLRLHLGRDSHSLGCDRLLGCAFGFALRLGLGLGLDGNADTAHRDDLERGQVGACPTVDANPLLGLVAQHVDARPTPVRQHLRLDVKAIDDGIAHLDLLAVAEQQHPAELERRTGLRRQAVDQDPVTRRYSILLSAADDDSRQRTIWLGHGV